MKKNDKIVKKAVLRMKAEEFIKSGRRFNAVRVITNAKKSCEIGMLVVLCWLDEDEDVRVSTSVFNINDNELVKMWDDCVNEAKDKFAGKSVAFESLFTAADMSVICGDNSDMASDLLYEDFTAAIERESIVYAF